MKTCSGKTIRELRKDEFELYGELHSVGSGMSFEGESYVSANNKVLYGLACRRFFIGYAVERPAGVGVMYMHEGIASFTFAATVSDFRSINVTKRDRRP